MILKCCDAEIQIHEVEAYPVESLDDLKDPARTIKFCPFCGKEIA